MLAELVFLEYAVGAVAFDVWFKKVPNVWNGLFLAAGVGVAGLSFPVFSAFGFGYLLWRFGVWGAGDAKFFAGLSLFASAWLFDWGWLSVFLASAVLVLGWVVFNRLDSKALRPPFVPFLVAGFAMVWLLGGLSG